MMLLWQCNAHNNSSVTVQRTLQSTERGSQTERQKTTNNQPKGNNQSHTVFTHCIIRCFQVQIINNKFISTHAQHVHHQSSNTQKPKVQRQYTPLPPATEHQDTGASVLITYCERKYYLSAFGFEKLVGRAFVWSAHSCDGRAISPAVVVLLIRWGKRQVQFVLMPSLSCPCTSPLCGGIFFTSSSPW